MPLRLTSEDQQRFTTALRAMVTLDAAEPAAAWELRVLRALKPLLRAERGGFFYHAADELPAGASEDYDYGVLSDYKAYYSEVDPGRQRWERMGGPVFSRAMLFRNDLDPLIRSECYNDFLAPAEMGDATGMALPDDGSGSPGMVALHRNRFGSEHFADRAPALLRMLYPAFVSGWQARSRLSRQADSLTRMVDALSEAAAIFAADGKLLHANRRLLDLLGTEPRAEELRSTLERAASRRARLLRNGSGEWWPGETSVPRCPGYRVQVTLLDSLQADTVLLVTAQPDRPLRPSRAQLIERFGLTPRQAEVALLLAQRRSNREIADQLTISPHTALRHTEAVKLKLGISDRRQVATRIQHSESS